MSYYQKPHSSRSSSSLLLATLLVINLGLSQAMYSPQMLRGACGVIADAEEVVGNQALAFGKSAVDIALKPIAVVGGLKAAAVGTGMKISGGAIKFVGAKMAKDGALLEATGAGVKGAGLGVAALGLKPLAEKVVTAGKVAEQSIDSAEGAASKFAQSIGDTSVQLSATLDGPLLGHHHKEMNMTAGLDTALKGAGVGQHSQQQQQIETQQVEQQLDGVKTDQQRSKRAAKLDTEVLTSALNLVREAKMEDCVARAICDLNCNPQGFGQDGKQVFMTMIKLQNAQNLDEDSIKSFKEAAHKGRQYSGKCDQCSETYSKCKSKSTDLIKMASHIRME